MMLQQLLEFRMPVDWTASIEVVTEGADDEHALLSPSSADRWTVCPGSTTLVPRSASSARSVAVVPVTEEMKTWVATAAEWVGGYMSENPKCRMKLEDRARAGDAFGCPDDMWGTFDIAIVNRPKRELVVIDAKFGYNEVEAFRNKQLLLYAIGLVHHRSPGSFDRVLLVILQPRSAEPVKKWLITMDDLDEWREWFAPRVEDARKPGARLVPTDEGCAWCPAAGVCPELQRHALEMAQREFHEPALMKREELLLLLDNADRIRDGLKAAEQHAAKLLALGQELPGWTLVYGEKRRVWTNEVAAGRRLIQLGVPAAEVFRTELQFTPVQAEKRVGSHFSDLLDDVTARPRGEATMCREGQEKGRDPVKPDFENLDEGKGDADLLG